jgi:hypothetical protein
MKINFISFELLINNVFECVDSLVNMNRASSYLKNVSFTIGTYHSYKNQNKCVILPKCTVPIVYMCFYNNKCYISFVLSCFRFDDWFIITELLIDIVNVQPLSWKKFSSVLNCRITIRMCLFISKYELRKSIIEGHQLHDRDKHSYTSHNICVILPKYRVPSCNSIQFNSCLFTCKLNSTEANNKVGTSTQKYRNN